MTWLIEFFFRFRGRVSRSRYWFGTLAVLAACLVVFLILVALAPRFGWQFDDEEIATLGVPFIVICVVSTLALSAKRLHDRDKSAWWLVVFYVPPLFSDIILGATAEANLISTFFSIWALIELGFLRGTDGPNRFGHEPVPVTA
jgi:uncharacterized membrane protein YhaH (DUF805 family)